MMEVDINVLLNIMLVGLTFCFTLMACLYLLLSPKVILSDNPHPYQAVRRDAGWPIGILAGSHLWAFFTWLVSDQYAITGSIASLIDMLLLLPFFIKFLIRLLQNEAYNWRKILVLEIPLVLTAIAYLLTFDIRWYYASEIVYVLTMFTFSIWYFFAVKRYSRWLRENFADLEYKETWWSFIIIAIVMLFDITYYFTDSFVSLYALRFMIVVLVGFVTWRADNVQDLQDVVAPVVSIQPTNTITVPDFTRQLEQLANSTQFYLQYDLTLQQLAQQLGTNRTYMSRYFMERGTTYNTYINNLRIEHFIRLYKAEAASSCTTPIVKPLALSSGYHSYSTFYDCFKRVKGMNVTQWIEQETGNLYKC